MGRRRRNLPGGPPPRGGVPVVAGHELGSPLGFGANGPVWAARDGAGRDVVVSVLPLPRGEAGAAQLRRLAALRHVTHPHLATIRQVVSIDAHRCAVVSARVQGPTLETVRTARGPLDDGELATLLAGVGNALGHLHERGVVHGDVSPANVIITDDGEPVLVDLAGQVAHELGTPGFVPPERSRGAAAGAPGDVWALARLVLWAAGESDAARLLLGPALDADPGSRPGPRDVAVRAPALGTPRPVAVPAASTLAQARMRVDGAPTRRRAVSRRVAVRPATREDRRSSGPATGERGSSGPAAGGSRSSGPAAGGSRSPRPAPGERRGGGPAAGQRRHARARPTLPAWLGACVTMATAAALAAVVVLSMPPERAATYGHTAAAGTLQPGSIDGEGAADVVAELLSRRDEALVARDAVQLAATTAPGGPAAREDAALLAALVSSDTTLEDLRTRVDAVASVAEVADGTAVDVVLVQEPHARVVSGRRVAVPEQPPACSRLVLTAADDGAWRVLRTEPCP